MGRFGSGLAAIDCVIKMLNPGDEVISTNDLYGGYTEYLKPFLKNMVYIFILWTW